MKACLRLPMSASSSPITSSDCRYAGAVSMTDAPAAVRPASTSRRAARSSGRRRAVVVSADADDREPLARRRHGLGHRAEPTAAASARPCPFSFDFSADQALQRLRSRQRRQPGLDDVPTSRHFFLRAPSSTSSSAPTSSSPRDFFTAPSFFGGLLCDLLLRGGFLLAEPFSWPQASSPWPSAFALAFAFALALAFGFAAAACAALRRRRAGIECTANDAPAGSITAAIRPPPGTSMGATSSLGARRRRERETLVGVGHMRVRHPVRRRRHARPA